MQTVLIVIHIMVVLALIATVLLQRSEGGALGIGGGGGFMTGRGQANVLTRATAILGALFFATSLALTLLANANRPANRSSKAPSPRSPRRARPRRRVRCCSSSRSNSSICKSIRSRPPRRRSPSRRGRNDARAASASVECVAGPIGSVPGFP